MSARFTFRRFFLLLGSVAGTWFGPMAHASLDQKPMPILAPHADEATAAGRGLPTDAQATMVLVAALSSATAPVEAADQPVPRTDANSLKAHEQLLSKRSQGKIDLYFMGDSITRRWGASDHQYAALLANWNENFKGWNAADFGWGADKTQNMLWRLEHGELDGIHPKVIVLMAGTNNIGNRTPAGDVEARAAEAFRGVGAVLKSLRARAPQATIVLMGITPRNDNIQVMPIVEAANRRIARLANGRDTLYLNINAQLADRQGVLFAGMTVDGLHPTVKAYQLWADALKPILTKRLGPKSSDDQAPPPTGDPSAAQ